MPSVSGSPPTSVIFVAKRNYILTGFIPNVAMSACSVSNATISTGFNPNAPSLGRHGVVEKLLSHLEQM